MVINENKKAIEALQYLPFMITLQSVQVQPGQIQWPQLHLPNMADPHLGAAEAGKKAEQQQEEDQEEEQEDELKVKMEWEPLEESLRPRVAAAQSCQEEEEEEETVKVVEVCSPWQIHVVRARHWNNWERLQKAVAREGESAKTRGVATVRGDKALLYVNKRWERVIVKKVGEGSQTKVKLIDVGSSLLIPPGDLREISLKLKQSRCFTESISLAGVDSRPEETWNSSITNTLREILPVNTILTFRRREGGLGDLFIECPNSVKISVAQILSDLQPVYPAIRQEESVQNLNNNNNARSEKTVEKLPQNPSHISGPHSRSRPMFTPLLPASGFFRAKIQHLDGQGVVWVVPNDHIRLLSEVTVEISSCRTVCEEEQVDIGKLLICQTNRTVVRARILEVREGEVAFLNVDSGEPGQCRLQEVLAISPELLSIPPLAIPLQLYGLRQTQHLLEGERELARLLETIPRAQVTVSLLQPPGLSSSFPLPAIIRYSGRSEADLRSNLALTLLDLGLMSVAASHRESSRQAQLSGLDWLNFSSPLPLSSPPHPFPLAEGLWLSVTVQGIYFPLDEEEPTRECPEANKVSCHLVPLSSQLHFNFCQREITSCAKVSKNHLQSLEVAFEDLKEKLAVDAERGRRLKAVSPGDWVLVLVDDEWCRARVLRHLEDHLVQVNYTDYGHNGAVHIKDLRAMKERRRWEPVQVREFFYQMPESNQVRGF